MYCGVFYETTSNADCRIVSRLVTVCLLNDTCVHAPAVWWLATSHLLCGHVTTTGEGFSKHAVVMLSSFATLRSFNSDDVMGPCSSTYTPAKYR